MLKDLTVYLSGERNEFRFAAVHFSHFRTMFLNTLKDKHILFIEKKARVILRFVDYECDPKYHTYRFEGFDYFEASCYFPVNEFREMSTMDKRTFLMDICHTHLIELCSKSSIDSEQLNLDFLNLKSLKKWSLYGQVGISKDNKHKFQIRLDMLDNDFVIVCLYTDLVTDNIKEFEVLRSSPDDAYLYRVFNDAVWLKNQIIVRNRHKDILHKLNIETGEVEIELLTKKRSKEDVEYDFNTSHEKYASKFFTPPLLL